MGRRLTTTSRGQTLSYEIVGVVADVRDGSVRGEVSPFLFSPIGDAGGTVQIRSSLDARTLADHVRAELPRVHPSLRLVDVTRQSSLVGNTLLRERLLAVLSGFFACAGPGARRGRALRRLELRGGAADARDRHSPHARRAAGGDRAVGPRPRGARGGCRYRALASPVGCISRGSCGRFLFEIEPGQRVERRAAGVLSGGRRARRRVVPGAPRHTRRSRGGAAHGVRVS